MSIQDQWLRHVADLAKLAISPEDEETLIRDMGQILEFANRLSALDIPETPVTAHGRPIQNVLREDRPTPSFSQEDILANAPDQSGGCVRIPTVI
ncbi:MAG: Asp-tRNA(Asn)/Glu-tRNA(Gln) amidotransferase subunit GatC [Peptococcaceae bacterium]|jgi:aspartyl-tRNA(Asn)/glutamyl-tRNA(Gln) amidotransferase subunit C|nr:Asp-tRNA(Asn)/Glu-tRNA(Gln) amidotransferase subunit GatC [Peptococcaceae bacterium]